MYRGGEGELLLEPLERGEGGGVRGEAWARCLACRSSFRVGHWGGMCQPAIRHALTRAHVRSMEAKGAEVDHPTLEALKKERGAETDRARQERRGSARGRK